MINIKWEKIERLKAEDILFKNLGRMYYENIREQSEETKEAINEIILQLNFLNLSN
jgi:hypothetical protein